MSRSNEPKDKPFIPDPDAIEITDEKFQELADQTLKMIEELELGTDGMSPKMFIHFRTLEEGGMLSDIQSAIVAIAAPFNNDNKHDLIAGIGRKFFEKRWMPVAVFMGAEAWMSDIKQEDYDAVTFVPPSKDPNRKECLMIAGKTSTNDGCQIGIMIPIKRDEKNNMVRAGENTVTKEIDAYLLNHFFYGFFEKVANRIANEKDKPDGTGRI
jgi:hypothetical protein